MTMPFIYHYCTVTQNEPAEMIYNDGIITMPSPISSSDRFEVIRDAIAEAINRTDFSVVSLTLLNSA